MECPSPSVLPPGFQGARLTYGVGYLERPDGQGACFSLPSGWYYSDAGRARIATTVEGWQVRLDAMQARLEALQQPPSVTDSTPSSPSPWPLCVLASCALGFAVGRFTHRT